MKIRPAVRKILNILEKSSYEGYIVGGAVRDFLLQRPIRDIDICTNANVKELKRIFPKHADVGGDHGTLLVHMDGESFEVSEFKGDPGTAERSITTDLLYRDFTCNAIAMKEDGTIIDPFGGEEDIEKGIVRLVNDDPARLIEDPLRLLRGLRFAIELRFQLEEKTESWLHEYKALINEPAKERISQEFEKLFENPLSNEQLQFLFSHDVVEEIDTFIPNRTQIIEGLKQLPPTFSVVGAETFWLIASYSSDLSKAKKILKMYKQSRKRIKYVTNVLQHVFIYEKEGQFNDLHLYFLGDDGIEGACTLLSILHGEELPLFLYKERYHNLPIQKREELAITGTDLIEAFFVKEGKWVGDTLQKVEEKVVLKELDNDKHEIFQWIKKELMS